jgi:hypothetical protein
VISSHRKGLRVVENGQGQEVVSEPGIGWRDVPYECPAAGSIGKTYFCRYQRLGLRVRFVLKRSRQRLK